MDKKKLLTIQQELKAPKDLYNGFGKYSYRSAEGILNALKPLLKKTGTILLLSDELVCMGTDSLARFYVKATATLLDAETGEVIEETSAYAREEESKKGMDGSQVTGASSSYARKYALNGMFAIDDVKDSDSTNTEIKTSSKVTEEVKEVKTEELTCIKCGKKINEACKKNFGGMCATCYAKHKKELANG